MRKDLFPRVWSPAFSLHYHCGKILKDKKKDENSGVFRKCNSYHD